jgi:hypothetical protein
VLPDGTFCHHSSVSGVISGTNEPLLDTVADIALEPTQTVTGTVYNLGGAEALPGSLVTVAVPCISSMSPTCAWRIACDMSFRRGSLAAAIALDAMAMAPS